MSNLAIISLILGVLILIIRVPFVIAPKKTIKVYRMMLKTNSRIRIFGLIGVTLWSIAVYFSRFSDVSQANIITIVGVAAAALALIFIVIFTNGYRNWATELMNSMSEDQEPWRLMSFIVAAFGGYLIYLSIAIF